MVAPLVPALILGGSMLASSGKSKKGGGANEGADEAARLQAQIASQIFSQSQPLRGQIFGTEPTFERSGGVTPERREEILSLLGNEDLRMTRGEASLLRDELEAGTLEEVPGEPGIFGDFLSGGPLPAPLRVPFTAYRENLEDQYGVARENILSRIPARGGQLNQLLADTETSRARAIGEIPLKELPLRESLFNQAIQIATGSPVQAASVAGSAGSLFANLAAQETAQQQASGQAIGSTAALATKLAMKNRGGGGVDPRYSNLGGEIGAMGGGGWS